MCMEDIRLGRESTAVVNQTTIPANQRVQLCGDDIARTALLISNDGVNLVLLTPRGAPQTAAFGIALTSGTPFIQLTIEEHGNLVQSAWFGGIGATPVNVTVIETRLAKD